MKKIFPDGLVMVAPFNYEQARRVSDVLKSHEVSFLFLGKSGAVIYGFPDTTQDADLFVKKSQSNCKALVTALLQLGFMLTEEQRGEIIKGKGFIQLKNGPFDLDLVFAPDGIEGFEEALSRSCEIEGIPVCHLDDIIKSKQSANRIKDKEVLPRLIAFRDWWLRRNS